MISLAVAGFSAVSSLLLFFAYAVFIRVPGKSALSVLSCATLVGALFLLQVGHFNYFQAGPEPLTLVYYRLGLFTAPSAFYFFGRWAILPTETFRPRMLVNLAPVLLFFVPDLGVSLPLLFTFGLGYSLWLGWVVYGLRDQRKQFRFEILYFIVMAALAVIVLALGFAMPHIDHAWFYHLYTHAIGLGIAILLVALVANPNLIGDLSEAVRAKYGASTLGGVDVDATLRKLNDLMTTQKLYVNEALSLSSLAAELGISGHQLSELVNARLKMGFSRYVRERRVEAAKQLLVSAPSQSILSVSLDTGFRSQSSFYAAFKEITGQSPGDFREAALRKDHSGKTF
ncbi:MAG TPA: helix-turn-helix domain-containing protein [Steroidobacteraceae bacterium]|nr:helix-turn-helix domain-containing protein [Steroidobacteraceae bacterium]